MSSSAPAASPSSACHLLHLPRDLLHSVLLFVNADDVDTLKQTCSGQERQTDEPAAGASAIAASAGSSAPVVRPRVGGGWCSFLSRVWTQLSEKESLSREATLRSLHFQRVGYKAGLDSASDRVDSEEGIMRAPFRRAFMEGARDGWIDAYGKGVAAAMACFAARHPTIFEAHANFAERTARINNAINSKLVRLPVASEPSTAVAASSSNGGIRIAAEAQSCSSSNGASAVDQSTKGCGSSDAACCSSAPAASGCCSAKAAATAAAPAAAAALSTPSDMPDLLPPTAALPVDGASALAQLAPLLRLAGISAEGIEQMRELPQPAPQTSATDGEQNAQQTGSSSAAGAAAASSSTASAPTPTPAAAAQPSVESAQMAALDW